MNIGKTQAVSDVTGDIHEKKSIDFSWQGQRIFTNHKLPFPVIPGDLWWLMPSCI